MKSAGTIDRLRECRPHTDKVCRRGRAPSYRALLHRRPLAIRSRNPKMWTDLLHEVHLTAAERGACLLLRQRDPRHRLHRRDGRAVRDRPTARTRRCARPSSLIWVVTTLRSVSIAAGKHCLLDTAFPALNPDLRSRFLHGRARSVGDRQYLPPGWPRVVRNDAPATVDPLRQLGRSGRRPPSVPPSSFRRRRSPSLAEGQSPARVARAPRRHAGARACATSHRTTAADRSARATRASRRARAPASSARSIAPGMARLAVGVGVALAVARLRVGAAAAAHADVAGLDRPRLLAGRIPSVQKALASIPAERSQHAGEAQRRRRRARE